MSQRFSILPIKIPTKIKSKCIAGLLAALTLSACQQPLGPGTATDLASESETSCGFLQNAYGQRVAWKTQNPVTFYLDSSVTTEFETALINTAKVWEGIVGRPLMKFQRTATESLPGKDGRNTIYMLQEWPSTHSDYQALTDLYWRYNRIEESDIKVNQKYFDYVFDGTDAVGGVHFGSLMLHELGHAMGMKHFPQKPTVMWPNLALGEVRMKPSSKDQENIKCEY